jgi:putative MATE family efflux protein
MTGKLALSRPLLRHPRDREILRLAVPAFFALVAEPLFLLADAAIVGHLGTPQLAGLGIASTILTAVVSLCIFLAYGTTAAVARRLGAGDHSGAIRQGVDGIWLAIVVGCGLTLTGLPFVAPVVGWFQPTAQVADYATTYLRISLLGIPAMLVVLAATGVLRGLQDTRTPLVVSVGGNLANIALNILLVYGVGLGIAGSALGTVLAQLAAAAIFMRVVVRGARRDGVGLRPDWPGIRASAGAAVPLLLRTLSLRVVLTIATVVATRIGTVAVAAHQVVFGIWSFLAFALDAIAIAGQAIVGRYLGSADVAATRAATRRMIEWGIAAGLVTGLATVAARPVLIPLFTTDSAVRSALEPVLLIAALFQPVAGIVFVLDGVLIGAGDARYLALAGLGTVAVFVPCALAVLAFDLGLTGLWWAMGIFMLTRLVFLSARAYGTRWLVTGATR